MKEKNAIAIGNFDGVHIGHQKILSRLLEVSQERNLTPRVLSIEPHPKTILFPQKEFNTILSPPEKAKKNKDFGIPNTTFLDFYTLKELNAEKFVFEILKKKFYAEHIIVGYDHKFGKNQSGDFSFLQSVSKRYRIGVEKVNEEKIHGVTVSSSKIRSFLEQGNMETANIFLGYDFIVSGTVLEGKKRGTSLGFPTINIQREYKHKLIPPSGVYATKVEFNGKKFPSVTNIGKNPTFNDVKTETIETHILDFKETLYGKEVTIHFLKKIREEHVFESTMLLKKKIEEDIIFAKSIFAADVENL